MKGYLTYNIEYYKTNWYYFPIFLLCAVLISTEDPDSFGGFMYATFFVGVMMALLPVTNLTNKKVLSAMLSLPGGRKSFISAAFLNGIIVVLAGSGAGMLLSLVMSMAKTGQAEKLDPKLAVMVLAAALAGSALMIGINIIFGGRALAVSSMAIGILGFLASAVMKTDPAHGGEGRIRDIFYSLSETGWRSIVIFAAGSVVFYAVIYLITSAYYSKKRF